MTEKKVTGKTTAESAAVEKTAMLQTAERQFGGPFVDALIKRLGPILAEVLLQWMMTRPAMAAAVQERLAVKGVLAESVLEFFLKQIEDNEDVVLDYIRTNSALLLHLIIANIRAAIRPATAVEPA